MGDATKYSPFIALCCEYLQTDNADFSAVLKGFASTFDMEGSRLADNVGVSDATLERWLRGVSEPTIRIRGSIVTSLLAKTHSLHLDEQRLKREMVKK